MDKHNNEREDSEAKIRRAFFFLKEKSRTPEAFSKKEFKEFAKYPNPNNFDDYFSKKFKHLLEDAPNEEGKYLVSNIFRKYSKWEAFRRYYSQSSKIKADYVEEYYENLMIFEFFLPLTNEGDLRSSLDELFYLNTVKLALNRIPRDELLKVFPKNKNESNNEYMIRICNWISNRFGGYSIGTVRGRFRVDVLKTYAQEAVLKEKGYNYLVDETTAIVRFIFHIGNPIKKEIAFNVEQFEEKLNKYINEKKNNKEAIKIRYIFKNLFVRNILDLVNGEDEIWMLESGMRNCLYIWKNKLIQ